MKRSELKMTGETYRLTPDNWGETYIMIDEEVVLRVTAEAFGISVDECDPDGDPNDRPESVELATDSKGRFYAILIPFRTHDGRILNENLYRGCENPADATRDGGISLLGDKWDRFDNEEEDE